MFRFGVDSLIWSEDFSQEDLWIISKARELGFEAIDINISNPDMFPTQKVKQKAAETGIEVVTSFGLNESASTISPDLAKERKSRNT